MRKRKTRRKANGTRAPIKLERFTQGQPEELGRGEKGRIHRDVDQLRCGHTRYWPTFERLLNASVCLPATRLRRNASMSSSIFCLGFGSGPPLPTRL